MNAPPQARPNPAALAVRDAKIYRLKIAGLTERAIAVEVDLSPTRVHEIITEQIAAHIGPVAQEYADHREAELDALWRAAHREIVTAKTSAERLKAIEAARRVNESRRKLRGADAPEAMTITHTANIELSSEAAVGAVKAALASITLPPDRIEHAISAAVAFLEASGSDQPFVPPAPLSSGLGTAPYVDSGAMYVDGPTGSGLRYRVVATEHQPGETADRPALMPAPPADAESEDPDLITRELDLIEAEYAEILEEVDDDDDRPEGDQAQAS
ncbi:hypothetical protein [Streptomyces sp. NPDC051665]|uniref:hypothetical protein n=1 Tax=Streptomyces sp. NPDC051665 TaxID=3154647 RepID=UPI003428A72C